MQVNISLGKRVRKLRLATGKSLNIFCFENDILKATLSNIENGFNTNPKLDQLRRIAAGLELTVAELLKGVC
ncbi:MAG: helix-turn-helix domain-containing protein [Candidatus Margulisbacteria bacterium]|jgi:transcriptional regulator with XRE-family HTH domain|nr:helix-turn-helix domain-containing protein [Candidatus Margulisiibacteriota bacterium]